MKLLGIDPGTATTGFGVIEYTTDYIEAIEYGQIKTNKITLMPTRLVKIYDSVRHLIEKHKPDAIVVEKLFFITYVKTAMTVGQSRGLHILAAGQFNIPLYEYTALQAKMILTGYGRAEKDVVREVVSKLLNIKVVIKPIDASDALAMALCHYLKSENIKIYDDNTKES